jgi:hypothetical protein
MDADEREIVTYLKTCPGQYISGREIARRASSKKRFHKEPGWAVPVLGRMVKKGLIESDSSAHFRLLPEGKKHKPKRWLSPEIQQLLEKTGKDFSVGVEIDEPEDPEENKPGG